MKSNQKNDWWLYSTILLFFILSIFLFINLQKITNKNNALQSNFRIEQAKNQIKDSFIYKRMNYELLNKRNFNLSYCDSILSNGSKLLVVFNEKDCKKCVLKISMDLDILSDKIGKNNMLYVGIFKSIEKLDTYMKNLSIESNYTIAKNLFSNINLEIFNPLLFVLDTNYNIKFIYDPIDIPSPRKEYFDNIILNYFKSKKDKPNI